MNKLILGLRSSTAFLVALGIVGGIAVLLSGSVSLAGAPFCTRSDVGAAVEIYWKSRATQPEADPVQLAPPCLMLEVEDLLLRDSIMGIKLHPELVAMDQLVLEVQAQLRHEEEIAEVKAEAFEKQMQGIQ